MWNYNDSSTSKSIKEAAEKHRGITLCIDCISTPPSSAFCAVVLAQSALYSAITPLYKMERKDITTLLTIGYSFLGEKWNQMGMCMEANQEDFEKAVEFSDIGETLLAKGKIRGHPVDLRVGGLESVIKGLAELKRGEVSGKKIVVKL